MANVEEISVLAVVEAQDKATGILSSIFGSITGLVDAYKRFGEASALSGQVFSDSMMGLMTTEERAATAAIRLQDAETMASEASMAMREAQIELGMAVEAEGFKSDAAAAAQNRLREATLANTIASNGLKDAQRDNAAAQEELTAKQALGKESLAATSSAMIGVGAVTAVAAGASVDLAAKFQTQTQTLVAGAGVQSDQIQKVRSDILQYAVDTGTSTKDLSDAFFQVNSRLGDVGRSTVVVKDAAELAKVHMADMATVGKALADAMNSYAASGLSASQASNILGTAVEEGGMSFQELSTSLAQVAPQAASLKIPLADVTGALATMTTQGMSTQQSAQDLRHAIEKLNSPTAGMITTWNQFGLTASQVQNSLAGPGGLQKAMTMIDDAIRSKMGPSGQIVIDTFKQSTDAANAMNMMLQKMDPSAKQLATELQNGGISAKDYTKSAKELTGASADQALQFKSLFDKANGFNDALKSGKPGFSDYNDALKAAYGDQTSLSAALMLTGDHADKWTKITKDATAAAGNANGQIKGWSDVQGTLSQKMAESKQALETAAITLGTALIPAVTQIVQDITPWIEKLGKLLEHHQTFVKVLVAVGLALGVLGMAIKAITIATEAWEAIQVVLDAELWANPIGVIILAIIAAIAAITAIVVAVIYAYNHFKWFHDLVNTVWGGIKAGAIGLWHILETVFKGIAAAAMWVYSNGILPLWHALEAAWNGIVTGAKAAFNGIVDAGKWLWDMLTGIWNSIVNVTTSVWDGITAFFNKWWPLLLIIFAAPIAVLMAIWNHFHTQITEVASSVWNGIKEFFVGTWNFLKTAAQYAWMYIHDVIIEPIVDVWHMLESVMGYLGGAISKTWNYLGGLTSAAWQQIKRYVIQPIDELLNWIGGNISRAWDSFSNTFNGIMNWLGGIGSWFESVGEDIVNGIISGLDHAGSWLMNKIKGLANDALGAAKSFLGIGSPSKLFAQEVGQWIPHGIAQGIANHAQVAVDAVQNMAGSLPQAIGVQGAVNIGVNGINAAGTVTATGLGLTAGGGGGRGGSGDIHVHMDMRDAIVAGDRGMTDLANRLGSALATQILPQAGVRLHTF
jgi:phage-related protein